MNFRTIKSAMLKQLGESLISEGFLFNKRSSEFEKGIPGGAVFIYIGHQDYGHRIFFELSWAVRIDLIADIYNSVTEMDEKYFCDTSTFSNSLGPLIDYMENGNRKSNADNKRYLILKDGDVPVVVSEMMSDIHKYIFPYFQQNHSVERANELLNHNPAEQSIHNATYPRKIMNGLIAAKLTHNPDYDRLVAIYDPEMEDVADHAKREYEKLKVVLAKM